MFGVLRVHGVGQREGEVKVAAPLLHGHAEEVAEPVEPVLRREAVEDQSCRGDEHGGEHDAEAHLGLADAGVLAG